MELSFFLRCQELDGGGPLDLLFSIGDTNKGWREICHLVRPLERERVKSLERPIQAGLGPHGFLIA